VVTQESRFAEGGWHPELLTLRLETGLPFSAELDVPTARLVRGLDGSRTLREALDDDAPPDAAVALARRMLEVGFLELVD
jgi:hypothetical protein